MKNIFLMGLFCLALAACGSQEGKKEVKESSTPVSEEQKEQVEKVSNELKTATEKIHQKTEKQLQEVDSLLQKI